MRPVLLVLLALLVWPAAASAEPCPVGFGPTGARVVRDDTRGTITTRVVICDDDFRLVRTVARARARGVPAGDVSHQRARGTVIWAAALAGRRIVWAEGTSGARRSVSRLVVADARTGRVRSRRTIWRAGATWLPRLAVALSPRGDLAWTGPPPRSGDHVNRVWVRLAGERPRAVDDDADELGFEDRGTLRVTAEAGVRFHDLRPPLVRDGCPVRSAFVPALDAQGILVSATTYADPFEPAIDIGVLRVCVRGEGTDRTLAGAPLGSPVLAAPPYVLFAQREGKFCQGVFALTLVDVRTLQSVKRGSVECVDIVDPRLDGDTVTWTDPHRGPQSVVLT